jgi:DNA-binding winged helix-turn-helix (wHTH) protein/Tfp pilus assembly protein PilF
MIILLGDHFLNTATGVLASDSKFNHINKTKLDHTALELLLCLFRYKGKDVSKAVMLNEVWPNKVVTEDVLSVAISQIRKALGDNARNPSYIKTIPGIGYRLIASVTKVGDEEDKKNKTKPTSINKTMLSRKSVLIILGIIISLSLFIITPNNSTNVDSSVQLSSQESIEHYQKGRFLLTLNDKKSWRSAQQIFEDTIINEPNYAPAYRELVNVKVKLLANDGVAKLGNIDEYYALLNKSLSLSPNEDKTHIALADVAFFIEWNFDLAEQHYKRATELAPLNGEAHFKFAEFLLAAGNFAGAIEHIQKYKNIVPTGYAVPSVAWIYNMMEDFDTAISELNKLKTLQPDSFAYHISAQAILENMGDEQASFNELMHIFSEVNYSEEDLSTATKLFYQGGLTAINLWLLEEKQEQGYIGQYFPPLSYARYAIKAGKEERAVDYILQALKQRDATLLWFNVDPKYKKLRQHPKLKNIINPK